MLELWLGSSESYEICKVRFRDLERCVLALSRRVLFVTDGESYLDKASRKRFGKKLVPQRYGTHKSRTSLLRKTLRSTNPIESMLSLVRHRERNITHTRKHDAPAVARGSLRR